MSPSSYLSLIKRYYRKNLLVLAGVTLYYKDGLRYIDIYSFRKCYSGVCMCVCVCVFQFSSVQSLSRVRPTLCDPMNRMQLFTS